MKNRHSKPASVALPTQPRRQSRRRILGTSAAALLAISMMGGSAFAAADNYTGATSSSWDVATNWSGGVPISTSQVNFPAVIPGTGATITLTVGEVADSLNFANTFTLTGGSLTLTTGNITVTGGGITTISSALTGAATSLTINTSATMSGGPALVLSGSNTYGGTTTVSSGVLGAASNGALSGTGVTVSSGATLAIETGVTTGAVPLSIAGTGVTSSGIPIGALFGGANAGSGTSTYAGAITLAANATIGDFSGGTAPFNLTGGINTNGSTVTLGYDANGGAATAGNINVNSVISGAGGVVVDSQTSSFNASNTYTGSTAVIDGGTLNANVAGALPAPAVDGGTGTVRSNVLMDQTGGGSSILNLGANQAIASLTGAATSTVNLNSNALTIGAVSGTTTFAGVISGTGSLIKDNTSTQILSGNNTYGGTTTVASGIMSLASNGALSGSGVTVASGATLSIQVGVTTAAIPLIISGNGLPSGSSFIGALQGSAFGPGTSTYAGSITLAADARIGDAGFAGDQFNLTGGVNTAGHTVTLGWNSFSGSINVNSTISGAGGVIADHQTVNFNAANTYTGSTAIIDGETLNANVTGALPAPAVDGGTGTVRSNVIMDQTGSGSSILSLGANQAIASLTGAATSTVTLGGNTLTIGVANPASTATFAGVISGAGSLTKDGTSTQVLTGSNTYTGTTVVNAGVLNIQNGLALGFADGTAATGTSVLAGATLQIQGGITVGNEALTLAGAGTGAANQDGALVNVSGINNYGGALTLAGNTTISSAAGTLNLTNATAVIGAFALTLNNSATDTGGGSIAGSINALTSLTVNGTGSVWVLNGNNSGFAGPITVNNSADLKAGVTSAFGNGAVAAILNNTAALDLNGFNNAIGSLSGAVGTVVTNSAAGTPATLTVGNQIVVGPVTNVFAGTITDTGVAGALSLFVSDTAGIAPLTLTGANSYHGLTTVSTGILNIQNSTALGAAGTAASGTVVSAGAALQVQGGIAVGNEFLTLNGTGAGAGATGALENVSGTNTWAGPVTLGSASTITVDAGAGSKLTLGTTGTAVVGGGNVLTLNAAGAGATKGIGILAANLDNSVASLVKSGTGTWQLSGNNASFTNAISVTGGVLQAGSTTAFGGGTAVTLSAGTTLDLNGFSNTIGSLTSATVGAGTVDNTAAGPVTLTTGAAGGTTFSGVIQNTGGALSLTKVGAGTVFALTGANTYTGLTSVTAGMLVARSANALGSGSAAPSASGVAPGIVVSNGASLELIFAGTVTGSTGPLTLTINGNGVALNGVAAGNTGALVAGAASTAFDGSIYVASNSTINANGGNLTLGTLAQPTEFINKAGVNLTFAGNGGALAANVINVNEAITGAGANSDLLVTGTTVNLNVADTYNGKTIISSTNGAFANAAGTGNGFVGANVANALPTANGRSTVQIDLTGTGGSTLNLVANQSIASLESLAGANSSVILGNKTLTIGFGTGLDVNGTANANFAGVISGAGGGITKDETSTQIFSGTNTYSGATTINGGTLQVNGSLTASNVTVNSGGTLGGIGSISQTVTVNSGGHLAPGNSPGITVGNLVLNAGSNSDYALAAPGGVNDLTTVTGNLTLPGAAGALNVTPLAGFGAGTYRIFNYGTLTGSTMTVNGLPVGDTGIITTNIPGQVNLLVLGSGTGLTQYWDGANVVANGVVDGGTGTWNNSSTNWTNAVGTANSSWQNGVAVFQNVGGTVTLGENIYFQGLEFDVSNYVLNGGGFTLNAENNAPGGTATINVLQGVSATINAPIVDSVLGSASLTKIGAGTVILTASNTYTGATNVNAGTLQVGNGASGDLAGTSGVAVANGAALATNLADGATFRANVNLNGANAALNAIQSGTNTLSGVISGTGIFNQNGTGTTILTATNTYTGTTTVTHGTLQVDGAIASQITMVNAGGTLTGKGMLGGSLNNSGTVQPGKASAPDTMTVSGNYTQASNGNLRIGLGSNTSYGRLAVNGSATLGGTVTAVSVNGFKPQVGDNFVILTAKNGVNGQFNTFQDQTGSGLLFFQPDYTVKNQVSLSTVVSAEDLLRNNPQFITSNRLATAVALDQVAGDPRFAKVFNYLAGDTVPQFATDLDHIAHEAVSSLHNSSNAVGSVQTGNIGSRTEQIRSGFSGFSALGFHMAGAGPAYAGGFGGPNGDDGKDNKEMKEAAPYDPRLGVFLTGVGEWVNVDDTANARGYDVATGGFTLGVDYKITPNFALGINAGYANTGVDLNDGSHMRINTGKLGLYSTFFTGGFYIDTAVQGGYSSYDSQRAALAGDARGSTDGGDLETLFATGYDFHAGGLTIGPTGNFQYGLNEFNSFSEHGSLVPLTFPSQSQESYRTAFGMHAVYDWKAGGMTLRPELRLAWQHEYGTTTYPVTAQFTGANNNFTVDGPQIGRDSLLVGVGMTMIINERTSTYLYYNGEYARTNFLSNTVSGGIRITF